ncbi:MAG: type II toxin-antitoxin system death-on-curing family toxin [Pseudomonadota bacterium]
MTNIEWPEPEGVLAYLRDRMASRGATLQVASQADLIAGFERARTAHAYEADAAIFRLAALMFDGIATRHPLVDGNKRLAWMGAIVLLDLNGLYLDAPEDASYRIGMAVIGKEKSVEDLAAFFEEFSISNEY